MNTWKLAALFVVAGLAAAPAWAMSRPAVATHPHHLTAHDRTPHVHFRNVVEHHGR